MRLTLLILFLSLVPVTAPAQTYLFSAPPWLTQQVAPADLVAVADYVSRISGQSFIYQAPGDWSSYLEDMRKAKFDLVIDDPHLISWRVENRGHTPLAKLEQTQDFVIVTRRDNEDIVQLGDLAGHIVCAPTPPSLGAVIMLAQFDNPARQPQIQRVRNYTEAHDLLRRGRCQGAIIPVLGYRKIQATKNANTRILFHSDSYPAHTFSAGPRIPVDLRDVVRRGLLSPQGAQACAGLLQKFSAGSSLLPVSSDDYAEHHTLLREYWGFDQ